jgi:5-methylcytosine-specific restriction protein A
MPAFLITWRPSGEIEGRGWPESNIRRLAKKLAAKGHVEELWPFQSHRMAKEGERVFLVRQGRRGHALFGYGRIAGIPSPYEGSVEVSFDVLTVPSEQVLATKEELHAITPARGVWGTRASGMPLLARVVRALERMVGRAPIAATSPVALSSRRAGTRSTVQRDDSIDDLPRLSNEELGSDGAGRVEIVTSGVKRDIKVRKAVLRRSRGICERQGCGTRKSYRGFLDVHHILGAAKSDRVWNCVALCPNCHRDAHAAPDRDQINAKLLTFASKFRSESGKAWARRPRA